MPSPQPLTKCVWCLKDRRTMSEWEQERLGGKGWARLCNPCARKRLNNPWNALLGMRKVEAAITDHCPAQTGPVWKLGGEPCGCRLPAGHETEPPHDIDGIDSRTHQCDCGSWWVDSIRKDEPNAH